MSLSTPGVEEAVYGANEKSYAAAEGDSPSSLATAPSLETVNSPDESLGKEHDHCPQDETLYNLSYQCPVQDETEAVGGSSGYFLTYAVGQSLGPFADYSTLASQGICGKSVNKAVLKTCCCNDFTYQMLHVAS